MTDFRALCAELLDALDSGIPTGRICMSPLANRARAALAEQPVGPTDEELLRTYSKAVTADIDEQQRILFGIRGVASGSAFDFDRSMAAGLRAILVRWGQPATAPVPVSERLPVPEDCDAEGRCW